MNRSTIRRKYKFQNTQKDSQNECHNCSKKKGDEKTNNKAHEQ